MTTPNANQVNDPQPGVYRIDPDASTIRFETRAMFGMTAVRGTFAVDRGQITVDPDATRSSVDAVILTQSFDSGDKKRDEHICSPAFLDAKTHPEIVFHSDSASRSAGAAAVNGSLTVHGQTQPTVLTLTSVATDGDRLTATATAVIDRYTFGVTKSKGLAGRRLTINLDVVAVR